MLTPAIFNNWYWRIDRPLIQSFLDMGNLWLSVLLMIAGAAIFAVGVFSHSVVLKTLILGFIMFP
jgi:hypothetical protein